MLRRTVTSIVLILITVLTIFLLPAWGFAVMSAIFIGSGLYEFFKIVEQKNPLEPFRNPAILAGILIPFLTYLGTSRYIIALEKLFFAALVFLFFIIQFIRKENQDAVLRIAVVFFGIFYVGVFFNFLLKIRLLQNGAKLVAYLILVTKSGDMGAYLTGVDFGRHKLIPRISPNKSIEGAIGGFLFSLGFAFLSRLYLQDVLFFHIFISGVLIGIFAQLGDLAESVIKRDYAVKDSGPFIPGLGGVLDLVDSILFTAPLFYFYLKIAL